MWEEKKKTPAKNNLTIEPINWRDGEVPLAEGIELERRLSFIKDFILVFVQKSGLNLA